MKNANVNKSEIEEFVKGGKKKDKNKNKNIQRPAATSNPIDYKQSHCINPNDTMLASDQNYKNSAFTDAIPDYKESIRIADEESILDEFYQHTSKATDNKGGHISQLSQSKTIVNFQPIKIENIFNFNKLYKIDLNSPLWYIINPFTPEKYLVPISSLDLKSLYERKEIDGNNLFRPIDIYTFDTNLVIRFDKLSLINKDKWAEMVKISPVLKYLKNAKEIRNIFASHDFQSTTIVNNQNNKNANINIDKNENTLHITNSFIRKGNETEIAQFMNDTDIRHRDPNYTCYIEIGKEIDAAEGNWEKVEKKKKIEKDSKDESFYLIGAKKNSKNRNKAHPQQKVDIIPPEELVKQLVPKHIREANIHDPIFEKFKLEEEVNKKSKHKGKPQDLNVKLGFKY